ncbi:MAG: helix-turn-helix domain-containing protein [Fimbriimonas sp.]
MVRVEVPVAPLPEVVLVARSIHGDLPVQGWIVDGLWGMHLYRYSADLIVGGEATRLEPGYAGFTPAGARAEYHFEETSVHVFAHLRFPVDAETRPLPLVFPVGPRFPALWAQMEEAVGFFPTDRRRAAVRAWDVLLTLLDAAAVDTPTLPIPVWRTLELIEQRMHEPLSVAELAHEVGLSHNHLTRLFRASTGQTVVEAIAHRRMERTRHLLQFSNMPVKEIAVQVGLPDLQHFNKAVRKHLGAAPTRLRK